MSIVSSFLHTNARSAEEKSVPLWDDGYGGPCEGVREGWEKVAGLEIARNVPWDVKRTGGRVAGMGLCAPLTMRSTFTKEAFEIGRRKSNMEGKGRKLSAGRVHNGHVRILSPPLSNRPRIDPLRIDMVRGSSGRGMTGTYTLRRAGNGSAVEGSRNDDLLCTIPPLAKRGTTRRGEGG